MNLLKRAISAIKSDFNKDISLLRFDIRMNSERRLIRRALKRAYKLHMANNQRYYVLRFSFGALKGFPFQLVSGYLSNKRSICLIASSKQILFLKQKHVISKMMWKRRHDNKSIFYVDGYFNSKMKGSFSNIDKFSL